MDPEEQRAIEAESKRALTAMLLYLTPRYGQQGAVHICRKVFVDGWTRYSIAELQELGDKVAVLIGVKRVSE